MRKYLFIVATLIFSGFVLNSCSNDENFDSQTTKNDNPSLLLLDKEKSMARFAEILSKASYEKKDVRDFLKSEALKKIDNGYNIIYPLSKNKKMLSGKTFREALLTYSNEDELGKIEEKIPLLNIHIPEIMGFNVTDMDTSDDEIPTIHSKYMYLNGVVVDSLSVDEIPGFATFVIDESYSISKKESSPITRTASNTDIQGEYEYTNLSFVPIKTTNITTRTSGYENLSKKYQPDGAVPRGDLDPELIKSYNNSINNKSATRTLMYYGMSTPNSTPGNARKDVTDCLFRFKLAGTGFSVFENIASGGGQNPIINGSTSNKKSELSREQVLSRLLTGQPFVFTLVFEGDIAGQNVKPEKTTIYVTPDKLFNLKINESKRHKTAFRHSKYTYSIDKNAVESKWFYPLDYGHDTRLNRWDVANQPITKRVYIYLINPRDGQLEEVSRTYSTTYVSKNELGADITGKIKDIINIGINGKISSETTNTKTITSKYTIAHQNKELGYFDYDFFADYPIVMMNSDGSFVIPIRKGSGPVETSILPITSDFFTLKNLNIR